jgi:septal ring-binding cell division protein DamX
MVTLMLMVVVVVMVIVVVIVLVLVIVIIMVIADSRHTSQEASAEEKGTRLAENVTDKQDAQEVLPGRNKGQRELAAETHEGHHQEIQVTPVCRQEDHGTLFGQFPDTVHVCGIHAEGVVQPPPQLTEEDRKTEKHLTVLHCNDYVVE